MAPNNCATREMFLQLDIASDGNPTQCDCAREVSRVSGVASRTGAAKRCAPASGRGPQVGPVSNRAARENRNSVRTILPSESFSPHPRSSVQLKQPGERGCEFPPKETNQVSHWSVWGWIPATFLRSRCCTTPSEERERESGGPRA